MPALPPPLLGIEKTDPALYEQVRRTHELAMAPGEIDAKTKVLMVPALDAFGGAAGGVKVLAQTARAMGATEGHFGGSSHRIHDRRNGNPLCLAGSI